jgi:membrane protein
MRIPDRPPPWLSGILILGAIAAAWKYERPLWAATRPVEPVPTMPGTAAAGIVQRLSPYRMPWPWWRQVLLNTYEEIGNDRLLAVAAGVVFYALLAIFPAVTAFVSLYGMVASYQTINDHLYLLSYVLPSGGVDIVRDQIVRIISDSDGKLSAAFFVGLCVALWSANAGIKAMIDALNVIESETEQRSFIGLNALSLGLTLGAIGFLLVAVGAVVAFPIVMSTFGLEAITSTATWLVRWPMMLGVIMLALSVLYRFGPSGRRRRWRILSPGIVFAAVAWIAGSAGLSLYLSKFADYNATYGSLGAAIGLMMWMWLTTIVILAGAELDSEIDKLMPQRA